MVQIARREIYQPIVPATKVRPGVTLGANSFVSGAVDTNTVVGYLA